MGNKLSGKDLIKLGFPQNNAINIALGQISPYRKRDKKETILQEAKQVLLFPDKYMGHGTWGKVAEGAEAVSTSQASTTFGLVRSGYTRWTGVLDRYELGRRLCQSLS